MNVLKNDTGELCLIESVHIVLVTHRISDGIIALVHLMVRQEPRIKQPT